MNIALLSLTLFIVWLFSALVAFVAGFLYCRIKKRRCESKTLSEKERQELKRNQIEYENFMTYSGTPQDVVDG